MVHFGPAADRSTSRAELFEARDSFIRWQHEHARAGTIVLRGTAQPATPAAPGTPGKALAIPLFVGVDSVIDALIES